MGYNPNDLSYCHYTIATTIITVAVTGTTMNASAPLIVKKQNFTTAMITTHVIFHRQIPFAIS